MTEFKQPANVDEVSIDEYYDMIDESLNDSPESRQWQYYAMDFVASRKEWENFKAAMTRWMEKMDKEATEGFAMAEAEERESALQLVPREET